MEAGRNNLLVTICLMAYYVDTYMKGYLEYVAVHARQRECVDL